MASTATLQNHEPCTSAAEHDGGETNVAPTYEVQGRRTERDPDGKPREVVRLTSATSRTAAFVIAETMGAEKLTAWVFEADRRAGRPSYKLLGVVPAKRS
jgi:hypothetical protein